MASAGCHGCGGHEPIGNRGWMVDHDHACCPGPYTCGRCVRGVLCGRCNTVLGKVGDSPALLRSLADYLEGKSR
jgi:hypothetical protein